VSLRLIKILSTIILITVATGCNLPKTEINPQSGVSPRTGESGEPSSDFFWFLPDRENANDPLPTPTPDPMRTLGGIRSYETSYTVQPNDTLGSIARYFAVTLDSLVEANEIADPNVLSAGQQLTIPAPIPGDPAPDFKLIPDSEIVDGPYNAFFDLAGFIQSKNGQLARHQEEVEGILMTGTQIVEMVATNYSVNPRLLLALMEYQTGWLTTVPAHIDALSFPMGNPDPYRSNLYLQLTWAANTLNTGYYRWRVNALDYYRSVNGVLIPASPQINAGTAALHFFFAQLQDEGAWRQSVSEYGFIQIYQDLFGNPFDWTVDPIVPSDLAQPVFQLPFEPGVSWVFTGGAHGGWADGSAWSALDFAPPSETYGCIQNDNWVVAVADGLIVRTGDGAVVQDLDGDGLEQTGWTVLYMHVESRDRVAEGTYLQAGERIGHPSCEGGYSTGTHVHIARRYNGEWIAINSSIPFVMDGWTAVDTGEYYGGYLQKGDQIIEPCECKEIENMIQR
jgi:LasA protease